MTNLEKFVNKPRAIQSGTIVGSLTVWVIVLVARISAIVVVVVVVIKVLVWAEAIGNMVVVVGVLGIGVLADVEIIMAGVAVIVLKFALPVSYSVDVPSDVAVDLFMDGLADVMLCVLNGISIEVLADVSVNTFGVVMTTLAFPV